MESRDLFFSFLPIFLFRSGFAVLCGAIIGIERERKGKPAGFRTNTLICFGSSLYMLVSEFILRSTGMAQLDPTRIAAQVVTGIGFLGAGTIIQSRGTITGLTSAATIWVVAGIGLTVGAGFPFIGFIGALMTLGTLVILHRIEPRLLGKCHFVGCTVVFSNDGGRTRAEIAALLTENDFDMSQLAIEKVDGRTSKLHLNFCDKHPTHHRFLSELWRTPGIIEVTRDPNETAG
jgi:putative Mg2+ transporter-C (MgtC) family protein